MFVQNLNTDIISFQEFYSDEKEKFIDVESLKKTFNTAYCHTYYTVTLRKTDHWGMATFSKYPIVNVGAINFLTSSNNACMFSDIKIGKDTIRVYNIHFQSIHFKKEDYAFIDSLKSENEKPKENVKNSRRILRRLKKAFIKRAVQVDTVASHIAQSPYPVIVSGDFNDSPVSYTYQKISKNLSDAFMQSGFGLGQTYNGKFPSLRIDYILHSTKFNSYNFTTHKKNYSDHFALSCYFKLGNYYSKK
jgi:endonuclease/exonuclease/phosphatase family metal-dependent hydrolase